MLLAAITRFTKALLPTARPECCTPVHVQCGHPDAAVPSPRRRQRRVAATTYADLRRGRFPLTPTRPVALAHWPITSLRGLLVKIDAMIARRVRSIALPVAEVAHD
jgi:hypothetical protein